jgi:hypothetical protein
MTAAAAAATANSEPDAVVAELPLLSVGDGAALPPEPDLDGPEADAPPEPAEPVVCAAGSVEATTADVAETLADAVPCSTRM